MRRVLDSTVALYVRIEPEVAEGLRRRAEEERRTLSLVTERALAEYLERARKRSRKSEEKVQHGT
jgi:predicted transcriptional regulator